MTTPDPCESTAADLISLVYSMQCTLKLLTEMLAKRSNNPVSPHSWSCLAISQHYLDRDLRRYLH